MTDTHTSLDYLVDPEKVILTFFRGSRHKMLSQLSGVAGFIDAHFGLTAKGGTFMADYLI